MAGSSPAMTDGESDRSAEPNGPRPIPMLASRETVMTIAEMIEPTSLSPATPTPTPAPAAPRRIGLRLVLASIALVELIDGMSNAPVLLGDMSKIPGPGIGGAIIKAHLVAHPVLALSTLMFAAI